jgi:hypothetical protein
MPKIILQISYEIKPECREDYLALVLKLRHQFADEQKKNYTIYEQKGKINYFVEEFVCNSLEEYEALEDKTTESDEELVNCLETYLKDGKARYATLIEIS